MQIAMKAKGRMQDCITAYCSLDARFGKTLRSADEKPSARLDITLEPGNNF